MTALNHYIAIPLNMTTEVKIRNNETDFRDNRLQIPSSRLLPSPFTFLLCGRWWSAFSVQDLNVLIQNPIPLWCVVFWHAHPPFIILKVDRLKERIWLDVLFIYLKNSQNILQVLFILLNHSLALVRNDFGLLEQILEFTHCIVVP